eukprot:1672740-Rhodomonas_salina.1
MVLSFTPVGGKDSTTNSMTIIGTKYPPLSYWGTVGGKKRLDNFCHWLGAWAVTTNNGNKQRETLGRSLRLENDSVSQ